MIRSEAGMTTEVLLAGLAGGSYTVTDANGAALSSGALCRHRRGRDGDGGGRDRPLHRRCPRRRKRRRPADGDGLSAHQARRAENQALEGVYYEAAACFDGQDGLTAADYLSMKRAILGLA